MTAPHTVLLIDDNALIREAIAQLIEIRPSYRVVGKAGSMHQGVELAQTLAPEIILIDLHMPEHDGIDTLHMLREKGVIARFIMLTVSDSKCDVAAAMRAGAHGYLLKDMDPEELFDALAPDPQRPFVCVPRSLLDGA